MSGLLGLARSAFGGIKNGIDEIRGKRIQPITRTDCLMSAMAIFGLKYSSLLQFDKDCDDEIIKTNIKNMYGVKKVPSDTYLRERLDELDPKELRDAFKAVFYEVQRGKALEEFRFMGDYYLISADGTGMFESSKVNCNTCCVKNHKNGTKSYYHQAYCAAIVHPNKKTVIPFAPEAIMRGDGDTKNDCEINALKRFITNFRAEHPRLKAILTGDGLTSKAPIIRQLKNANMSFILGAKPGDHQALFEFAKHVWIIIEMRTKDGKKHIFRYANKAPLNDSNYDLEVNFLSYTEIDKKGREINFSWVTDIEITKENIFDIMKGGRARWKIENETFNTLKNQGYSFEHNFGHGYKHLCSVFAMLMMLAFLIDQIVQQCESLFQEALKAKKQKKRFWEWLRSLFFHFTITSWEDVWKTLIHGQKKGKLQPNAP